MSPPGEARCLRLHRHPSTTIYTCLHASPDASLHVAPGAAPKGWSLGERACTAGFGFDETCRLQAPPGRAARRRSVGRTEGATRLEITHPPLARPARRCQYTLERKAKGAPVGPHHLPPAVGASTPDGRGERPALATVTAIQVDRSCIQISPYCLPFSPLSHFRNRS
jgi:hypothetical protein